MTQDGTSSAAPELPAPQSAKAKVDRSKARKALLAAIGGAGAAAALIAVLSKEPVILRGGAPVDRLTTSTSAPASARATQPA